MTMSIDRQDGSIPAGRRQGRDLLFTSALSGPVELLYHIVEQYAGLVLAPDEEIILSMGGAVA